MRRIFSAILCLLCCSVFAAEATDNLRYPDTRALGMGRNGVLHSALFNPSLLAIRTDSELRLDYFNRYSVAELATVSGSFNYYNPMLPLGIAIASFGYDAYRESLFRLAAAKQIHRAWAVGVAVQYTLLQSELHETAIARLSADLGLTFRPTDDWRVSIGALNVPSVSIAGESRKSRHLAPASLYAGAGYQATGELWFGMAAAWAESLLSASFGMEYAPFKAFELRLGIDTAPLRPTFGISYRLSAIKADLVVAWHPVLGISNGAGLSFTF